MSPSHAYSPLGGSLSPTKLTTFAASNRRPLITFSLLLLFPLLAFIASYPVHQGHPIESLSSWGEDDRPNGILGLGGDEPDELYEPGGERHAAKHPCDKTLLYTFSGRE